MSTFLLILAIVAGALILSVFLTGIFMVVIFGGIAGTVTDVIGNRHE